MIYLQKGAPYFAKSILIVALMLLVTSSCSPKIGPFNFLQTQPTQSSFTPTKNLQAEVLFSAHIPLDMVSEEQGIFIDILDEVTGIPLNPSRYPMDKVEEGVYQLSLPVNINSNLKYRYGLGGDDPQIEKTIFGRDVYYRVLPVFGPTIIQDLIAGWSPLPPSIPYGRIQGFVNDEFNQPLVNVLVSAGGLTTLTTSTGSYLLDGLIPGTHTLSFSSLNGEYKSYFQGALVSEQSTTPADVILSRSESVKITFLVQPPSNSIPNIPIRIIGNTLNLGNIFADLEGGVNTSSTRAPLMTANSDGSYQITMDLPVGFNLKYKYSLGDGFWNTEYSHKGSFYPRQLIVPDQDTVISDTIEAWVAPGAEPIYFRAAAPSNTYAGDSVSIQFNSFGWTNPIPMWPLGNNEWGYAFYGPSITPEGIKYRYCRNDQCGLADDIDSSGTKGYKDSFLLNQEERIILDQIENWTWWQPQIEPTSVLAPDIQSRGDTFFTGIELTPGYHPSWQAHLGKAFTQISDLGAKYVIFTPTWEYSSLNPPIIEQVPGRNPLWADLTQSLEWASRNSLKTALFPVTISSIEANNYWWYQTNRDSGWWNSWFDRYTTFLVHHADLAAQAGASAIILGESGITPALPNGLLPDGNPSNVPEDSDLRWEEIIKTIRSRYDGEIIWVVSYPDGLEDLPGFISMVDRIYLLWSVPLDVQDPSSIEAYSVYFQQEFEDVIFPKYQTIGKPIILGLSYPSRINANEGCIPETNFCAPYDIKSRAPYSDGASEVDMMVQMKIFNGALIAVNSQDWIDGFVARGFYPPVILHDDSSSIYGKPAANVLWYWFPKLNPGQ